MKRSVWWFLMLAGVATLMLPIAGGAWLVSKQIPAVVEGWRSRTWPSAPATVERAVAFQKYQRSSASRSGQGTHVVELRYAYDVGGTRYTGERQSLDAEGKIYLPEGAEKLAGNFPVGSPVTAHYDAANPARSLLEPGVPVGGMLGMLLGATALGFGLYFLRMFMRWLWNQRPRRRVRYA